jgi:hypothetical protein
MRIAIPFASSQLVAGARCILQFNFYGHESPSSFAKDPVEQQSHSRYCSSFSFGLPPILTTLQEFPVCIALLPSIEHISLYKCALEQLPAPSLFRNAASIKWLDLSENPIHPSSFGKKFAYEAFPSACVELPLPDEILTGRLYIGNESR